MFGESLSGVPEAGASHQPPLDAACCWERRTKPDDSCPLPGAAVGGAGRGPPHSGFSGLQSVYERQGIAVMTPTVPGSPKGPFLGLPRGTMRRQKSIGKKRSLHSQRFPLALREALGAPRAEPTPRPAPGPLTRGLRTPQPSGTLLPAGTKSSLANALSVLTPAG